jgi:hypothetical protein
MVIPHRMRRVVSVCAVTAPLLAGTASLTRADLLADEPATISTDPNPATGFSTVINVLVGADRFYAAGYFGSNAMIANVEAGYVWNGHETLGNVTSYISNAPIDQTAPQFDFHATMVGSILVGLGPPAPDGSLFYYQLGMAPGAFLSSVAIATDWVGSSGQFDISSSTFVYGYTTVMQTGVSRQILPGLSITRPVDVVNSSWGYDDPNASQQPTMILDALAAANHQTVCVAAGNHNSGTAQVDGPASGFNVIAVAALGSDTDVPPYQTQAGFSNAGPNDFFNPVTGQTIPGVRAAVSIAAPGTDLVLAAYTGSTGQNAAGHLFDLSGIPTDELNQLYVSGEAGTSFASPTVAGGAALVVDAGYVNFGGGVAVDGRVIKAVLLNSASKVPGWTNNATMANGVFTTTQGLDFNVGAGALNLNAAYDQYLSGSANTTGLTGGTVHPLGWAYGHVAAGTPNTYVLDAALHAGDTFTSTLDWFIPTFFNINAVADPVTENFSDADLHEAYFDVLDLQLWTVIDGQLGMLIADSHSPYNNVDQIYMTIPADGDYAVEVSWWGTTYDLDGTSPQADDYGLAWADVAAVPEPASLTLLLCAVPLLMRRRKR